MATTAANYPELVRAAILEDPPWRADIFASSIEERLAMMEEWRADLAKLKLRNRVEVMAHCRTQNPTWAEVEWGPWADSKRQLNLRVFESSPAPRTPWQDVVRKITCPVLLITADLEKGALVTPEGAQEAAGLWREGQVAHIDGAGHSVRREQFEKYMAAVAAFLEKSRVGEL